MLLFSFEYFDHVFICAVSAFIRIDDLTFSPFNFITNTTLGVHYAKDISALSGIVCVWKKMFYIDFRL